MDLHDTIRTYRLFSGSYDIVFGPVFHPGRKDAVRIANDRPGQRILEVGVGTGLTVPTPSARSARGWSPPKRFPIPASWRSGPRSTASGVRTATPAT